MLNVIRSGQNQASQSPLGGVLRPNSFVTFLKKPAVTLAFLMAIFSSVLVAGQSKQLHSASPVQSGIKASYTTQSSDSTNASEATEVTDESNDQKTTNTVTTKTAIENGQAKVNVQVNGQEVPVPKSGSSSQTIYNNGNLTNIDVSIQNGQTGTTTSTFGTNSSSSFSTSFQSITISGNH